MSQSLTHTSTRSETSSCTDDEKTFSHTEKSLVIIFDWDNTLFCTDYLKAQKLNFVSIFESKTTLEEEAFYLKSQIEDLEKSIICLFDDLLVKFDAKIFIITNADNKWITNCLYHFMPDLFDFLTENCIKIYSAKNLFNKFPLQRWKTMCFRKVIYENITEKESHLKILSIGDSDEEKNAVFALKSLKFFKAMTLKCIETGKSPDVKTLIKQFEDILIHLDQGFLDKKEISLKIYK